MKHLGALPMELDTLAAPKGTLYKLVIAFYEIRSEGPAVAHARRLEILELEHEFYEYLLGDSWEGRTRVDFAQAVAFELLTHEPASRVTLVEQVELVYVFSWRPWGARSTIAVADRDVAYDALVDEK